MSNSKERISNFDSIDRLPMQDLKILVWAINESKSLMQEKCKELLVTADLYGIEVTLFGIGHRFVEHKQRLQILYDYLKKANPSSIVVCMDGSDTLFNDSADSLLNKFKAKNTRILISGEKGYSYQYPQFKEKFNKQSESPYRYVNAGTFMGYAGDLLKMMEEIFELDKKYPSANDQGLLGIWMHENLEHPKRVQLDTDCDVFWVTTGDWIKLKEIGERGKTIYNPYKKRKSVIIHNVGNNNPRNNSCYQAAFKNIVNNHNKERFRICLISPLIYDDDYELMPPKLRRYNKSRVPIWDLFQHPNISFFYYGDKPSPTKSVLKTKYYHEAILTLEEKFLFDYIVHLPKGFLFYHDELYDFIKNDFSKIILESGAGEDFPKWEAFVYWNKKYFPIDIFFRLDSESAKTDYLGKAEILSPERAVNKYRAMKPRDSFEFISIGGWCGPAIGCQILAVRKRAYPFCAIHSTMECLIEVVNGNRSAYYDDGNYTVMPHFKLEKPGMREKLDKRLDRFAELLQSSRRLLFIRTIISKDYSASFKKLEQFMNLLKEKYGRNDRMLIFLHDQNVGTVKLQMLNADMMIWAAAGKVGWHTNKNEIMRNYARAIEYCMVEENWEIDERHIKSHTIVNHRTWGIHKELYGEEY